MRPRKRGNKDLPPGLYKRPSGFYVRHPHTNRQASLGTKDRIKAVELFAVIRARWDEETLEHLAAQLAARIEGIESPRQELFTTYAAQWAAEDLSKLDIRERTRYEYQAIVAKHIAPSGILAVELGRVTPKHLHAFLDPWVHMPPTYNHIRSVLQHICRRAVLAGKADVNPADSLERIKPDRRGVYLPDEHYNAIIAQLPEWQARACDLCYLTSQRPGDVLALKEENIVGNEIHLVQSKTGTAMVIEMNSSLAETVEWFRRWKRTQGLHSRHIVCYPRESYHRKDIAKPVPARKLSGWFREAMRAAGLDGYQLRDLRSKGLTDESHKEGKPSAKGGHTTEAMRRYYVKRALPVRTKNTLTLDR